jgi:hypothetical protein
MVPRLHERLLDQILNLLDRGDVVRDLGDDNARQAFWFGLIQFLRGFAGFGYGDADFGWIEGYLLACAFDYVSHAYCPQVLLMVLIHCAPGTGDCPAFNRHVFILRYASSASSIVKMRLRGLTRPKNLFRQSAIEKRRACDEEQCLAAQDQPQDSQRCCKDEAARCRVEVSLHCLL